MRIILLADDKSRRLSSATQQAKDYYPYSILRKITPTTNQSYLQDQKSDITNAEERATKELSSSLKRILVIDDDPDITLAFKVGLEDYGSFDVYTHNDPLKALSNFKPHFYDLLLLDINMPKMNGLNYAKELYTSYMTNKKITSISLMASKNQK